LTRTHTPQAKVVEFLVAIVGGDVVWERELADQKPGVTS
jgi:hypothetical protein